MEPRRPFSLFRLFALSFALFVAGSAAGAGSHRYEITWREVSTTYTYDGRLDEGGSRNLRFDVRQENVTGAEFVLRWTETEDTVGLSDPDRFALQVLFPQGSPVGGSPVSGDDGYLRVAANDVNDLPRPQSVDAGSLPDLSKALARERGESGIGVWQIRVSLEDTGNPAQTSVDAGNAYVLTVTLRWYEPVVMRVVSLSPATELSMVGAMKSTPSLWLWTTAGLGLMSLMLGTLLVGDAIRRRRKARKGKA